MASLTLTQVTKRYAGPPVIEGLDLAIRDHELMVLVGPSGCGKSTVLRMIAGLEAISAGTIAIGGTLVNDLPAQARDVAMVFQNYALYPHLTVRENLEFGLRIRRAPEAERRRLVAEASAVLGLGALLGRKPRELSGGERQRVALGRAIVRKPSVFLFDEPLSNLDARLRVQMRAQIRQLQEQLGTTAVYVTHDQVEAMTMGHRLAVLHQGRLQQVGTPQEVYDRPANLFVAGFIGAPPMNLMEAVIAPDRITIPSAGLSFPVPPGYRAAAAGSARREGVAGFRPEAVSGPGKPPPPGGVRLRGVVEMLESLGDEVIVHCRAGQAALSLKVDPPSAPAPGATIDLHLAPAKLHVFDRDSGARWTPEDAGRGGTEDPR